MPTTHLIFIEAERQTAEALSEALLQVNIAVTPAGQESIERHATLIVLVPDAQHILLLEQDIQSARHNGQQVLALVRPDFPRSAFKPSEVLNVDLSFSKGLGTTARRIAAAIQSFDDRNPLANPRNSNLQATDETITELPPVERPPAARHTPSTAQTLDSFEFQSPSSHQIDHYQILRLLGQGGMGIVHLARNMQTDELVAIKQIALRFSGNERAQHRFLKEADNMKRIRHPNLLPVIDVAQHENGTYYVMQYVEGGSLARFTAGEEPMPESQLLSIALQVAEGLRHAHDIGIIHRDIKPENILVDEAGHAFITDFGLVRSLLMNETIPEGERGWTVGTARYMAPEIAEGKAGDTRADIYSFGAMLYEMTTGYAPYADRKDLASNSAIVEELLMTSPTFARELNPEMSANLLLVIEGCMSRQLRNRYAHMKDVVEDLKQTIADKAPVGPRDESPMATPPQMPVAVEKHASPAKPDPVRHLVLIGMIALLAMGILAGGAFWGIKHLYKAGVLGAGPNNPEPIGTTNAVDLPAKEPSATEIKHDLAVAVREDDFSMVEKIVAAEPSRINEEIDTHTVLGHLIQRAPITMLTDVLDRADKALTSSTLASAIVTAVALEKGEQTKVLVQKIDSQSSTGQDVITNEAPQQPAIAQAIATNRPELLAITNAQNHTPLYRAITTGNEQAAIAFIKTDAPLFSEKLPPNEHGIPVLHLAARHGRIAIVEELVKSQNYDISAVEPFTKQIPLDFVNAATHPEVRDRIRALGGKSAKELQNNQ